MINLPTKIEMPSFIHLKDRIGNAKFKNGSRDPENATFGTFVIHTLVPAVVYHVLYLKTSAPLIPKTRKRPKILKKRDLGLLRSFKFN